MRLAVRTLCYAMTALEQALDELSMKMRSDIRVIEARKAQRQARRLMSELLDEMIDKGVGD